MGWPKDPAARERMRAQARRNGRKRREQMRATGEDNFMVSRSDYRYLEGKPVERIAGRDVKPLMEQ